MLECGVKVRPCSGKDAGHFRSGFNIGNVACSAYAGITQQ